MAERLVEQHDVAELALLPSGTMVAPLAAVRFEWGMRADYSTERIVALVAVPIGG